MTDPLLPAALAVLDRATVNRERLLDLAQRASPDHSREELSTALKECLDDQAVAAPVSAAPVVFGRLQTSLRSPSLPLQAPLPTLAWNRPASPQARAERQTELAQVLRRARRRRDWQTEAAGMSWGGLLGMLAAIGIGAFFGTHGALLPGVLSAITIPPALLFLGPWLGKKAEQRNAGLPEQIRQWEAEYAALAPVEAPNALAVAWTWWDHWQTHPALAQQAEAWSQSAVGLLHGDAERLNQHANHLDQQPRIASLPLPAPVATSGMVVSEASLRNAAAFRDLARTATGPLSKGPAVARAYANGDARALALWNPDR